MMNRLENSTRAVIIAFLSPYLGWRKLDELRSMIRASDGSRDR